MSNLDPALFAPESTVLGQVQRLAHKACQSGSREERVAGGVLCGLAAAMIGGWTDQLFLHDSDFVQSKYNAMTAHTN